MADRTSNTVFYPKCIPGLLIGKTNASDGDTFNIPYGAVIECLVNSSDDNDAIATATASGQVVTIGLIDDAGSAVGTDTDIIFTAILKSQ